MSLRRDVRHGARIGRAELVRSVRGYVRNRRRLIGFGIAVLFIGGNFAFSLPAAYAVGRTARSVATIPYFTVAATILPVGFFLLATFRTLERTGSIEAEDLVLMTVHPRAVVIGLIGAEVGRLALWFGIPLGLFVTVFALGLGAPSILVSMAFVLVPLACWAAVWGYACGIVVLRVLRRLPGVRRALKASGIVAMVVLVVGSQFIGRYAAEGGVSLQALVSLTTFGPLVDYVALAFVGTPIAQPTSVRALIVLVALVVLTPIGLVVATRQASGLWFTDHANDSKTRQVRTSTGGFTAPRPFAWAKAGRIGWGHLVRGIRSPQEFSHLVLILFFVGPIGTTVVQSSGDALGPLIAGSGVGLGTYLAGATFGLNPLGDDRPQIPLLLLSETSPRTIVRGRSVSGLAVGIPVAVLVPLASVVVGTAPWTGVVFATTGVVMCLAATLFAVGLGAAYPIYEEREFWGTETVVPSTLVMMAYVTVVGAGTLVGLIAVWYALAGSLVVTPVIGVGIGLYLLLTASLSYGSYRYAVRRYRRYVLG